MNILFLVPYVPSLVRVRPFQLLRGLANHDHRITLLTLWSESEELQALDRLAPYCHQVVALQLHHWRSYWNSLRAIPSHTPLQAVYCWHPELVKKLGQYADKCNSNGLFDVIHIEHLRGVRYGIYLKKLWPDLPVIWDSVDCISHLFTQASQYSTRRINRWLTHFELSRTKRYEGRVSPHFDRVLVTSRKDRQALGELVYPGNKASIDVLPNGVDLTYFSPVSENDRLSDTLVISGKMSYHANVTMTQYFIDEIMPYVWAEMPGVKIWVVGKDPPRSISALNDHPQITVTGTVADIRPYLCQATVAVAPLRYGAGIQNKVLEAMACATPVVTTSLAADALQAIPGQDLLVEDAAPAFAKRILSLLANPAYRRKIGSAGRCFVEKHHSWDRITAQLEGIYHEVANETR